MITDLLCTYLLWSHHSCLLSAILQFSSTQAGFIFSSSLKEYKLLCPSTKLLFYSYNIILQLRHSVSIFVTFSVQKMHEFRRPPQWHSHRCPRVQKQHQWDCHWDGECLPWLWQDITIKYTLLWTSTSWAGSGHGNPELPHCSMKERSHYHASSRWGAWLNRRSGWRKTFEVWLRNAEAEAL